VLARQLGLDRYRRDAAAALRTSALIALTVISLALIAIIAWLTLDGSPIPDLVAGLAGSGIGAIAGILSGERAQEAVSVPLEPGPVCQPSLHVAPLRFAPV
jgi:hypothetical protein